LGKFQKKGNLAATDGSPNGVLTGETVGEQGTDSSTDGNVGVLGLDGVGLVGTRVASVDLVHVGLGNDLRSRTMHLSTVKTGRIDNS
jgi:hypothetical protein